MEAYRGGESPAHPDPAGRRSLASRRPKEAHTPESYSTQRSETLLFPTARLGNDESSNTETMMVEVIRSRDNLMWHAPATRDPLTRWLNTNLSVSNRAYWAGNSHVKQSLPSGRNERVETAWRDNCYRQ